MEKHEKTRLRADIFCHLDGIVTAPTAYALYHRGVLEAILAAGNTDLSKLALSFKANEGYLNVALHTLASQGWLDYEIHEKTRVVISTNEKSKNAFGLCNLYQDVVELMKYSALFHPRKFEEKPFQVLRKIFKRFQSQYDIDLSHSETVSNVQLQILKHIEGMIVGPTIVALGMGGMFHKYFMEVSFKPEEFHHKPDSFEQLLDILVILGWFNKNNGNYRFTEKGLFFAKRASAYGVTVSYLPTFRKMDELLFGDPLALWNVPNGSSEIHVDREMNVWGSGGAHANYFRAIDNIVIDIFNKPISEQPKGIVDMGCGNGAFLIHVFEVIANRTLRGTMLEEHPLFLVGADFNETALKVTKKNLILADIWAKVIWGDISRPDLLEKDLNDNYGIRLQDMLNVRTFLDHNRIWKDPSSQSRSKGRTAGAFAFRGKWLSSADVEENLKNHINKWKPYVEQFGLLIIELHTISPKLIGQNLGQTPATAYNATHGFSDQYIVELEVFLDIAAECGLLPESDHSSKYPSSELATVSINLLKANPD